MTGFNDALYDPHGVLAQMEKRIEERAVKRHKEVMDGFITLGNAIMELSAFVKAKL
jgi:hypothetical protein